MHEQARTREVCTPDRLRECVLRYALTVNSHPADANPSGPPRRTPLCGLCRGRVGAFCVCSLWETTVCGAGRCASVVSGSPPTALSVDTHRWLVGVVWLVLCSLHPSLARSPHPPGRQQRPPHPVNPRYPQHPWCSGAPPRYTHSAPRGDGRSASAAPPRVRGTRRDPRTPPPQAGHPSRERAGGTRRAPKGEHGPRPAQPQPTMGDHGNLSRGGAGDGGAGEEPRRPTDRDRRPHRHDRPTCPPSRPGTDTLHTSRTVRKTSARSRGRGLTAADPITTTPTQPTTTPHPIERHTQLNPTTQPAPLPA